MKSAGEIHDEMRSKIPTQKRIEILEEWQKDIQELQRRLCSTAYRETYNGLHWDSIVDYAILNEGKPLTERGI